MSEPRCANCAFRTKYDNNPRSILGRIWRWHISFCPGWKVYMKSLTESERTKIKKKYKLKK